MVGPMHCVGSAKLESIIATRGDMTDQESGSGRLFEYRATKFGLVQLHICRVRNSDPMASLSGRHWGRSGGLGHDAITQV
jgi:hypothetical protein